MIPLRCSDRKGQFPKSHYQKLNHRPMQKHIMIFLSAIYINLKYLLHVIYISKLPKKNIAKVYKFSNAE